MMPNVFDPNKFRLNLVCQLLEYYDRADYKIVRQIEEVTDNPMRLGSGHFSSANKNKTPSGKQAMPDCVVCSGRGRSGTRPNSSAESVWQLYVLFLALKGITQRKTTKWNARKDITIAKKSII